MCHIWSFLFEGYTWFAQVFSLIWLTEKVQEWENFDSGFSNCALAVKNLRKTLFFIPMVPKSSRIEKEEKNINVFHIWLFWIDYMGNNKFSVCFWIFFWSPVWYRIGATVLNTICPRMKHIKLKEVILWCLQISETTTAFIGSILVAVYLLVGTFFMIQTRPISQPSLRSAQLSPFLSFVHIHPLSSGRSS